MDGAIPMFLKGADVLNLQAVRESSNEEVNDETFF
jgi:hypothetical protein